MATIGVFGASGFTGRLIAREVVGRGHRLVAIGRDASRLVDAVGERGDRVAVRVAAAHDVESLCAALEGVDVVIGAVGPFGTLGRGLVEAAIETRTDYVDVTGEQPFLRWVHDERRASAEAAGITMVSAAGFDFLPGDLLAAVAAAGVDGVDAIHVSYGLSSGMVRVTRGTRASLAELVGAPGIALVDGQRVEERPGEVRRLAWFPRPVGPRHAAGIPGGEAVTVVRHVDGVRLVRTYLALRSWQAELLQLAAGAARWEPARRRMAALVAAGGTDPSPAARSRMRWGVVAEAAGSSEEPGRRVARAWAAGDDMYGFTAVSSVLCAEHAGDAAPGVRAPAELAAAPRLLDELAARARIRWGVVRPTDAHTR